MKLKRELSKFISSIIVISMLVAMFGFSASKVHASMSIWVTSKTSTSITLSWAPISGETVYYLYSEPSGNTIYIGPDTTFTHTGLTPGCGYYYDISPNNGGTAYIVVTTDTSNPTSTPLPTSTPMPTATNTPTATPLPTNTPIPTATPLPTSSPVPTNTPMPTATQLPTSTPMPTATNTPTSTPTPYDQGADFATAQTITVGTQVNAAIGVAGDVDFFKFIPSTSDVYLISTTGSLDTVGELFDSSYNSIISNDDSIDLNTMMGCFLNAGQTYYAKIWGYDQSFTGDYGFSAISQYDDNTSQRVIQANSPLSGTLDYGGDEDVFAFTPSETRTYYIESTGGLDIVGVLNDTNGTQIATDDDSGTDNNFKTSTALNAGQTYYVKVRHYDESTTGSYGLSVVPQYDDNVSQRVIQVNSPLTGTLDYDGDEDIFAFTPSETRTYTIQSTGGLDSVGILSYTNGEQFAIDDDSGTDSNFQISITLNAGQTYYLRFITYPDNIGTYGISIT